MRGSVIDNIYRQHDNNNNHNNNIAHDRGLHMMLDSNINIARVIYIAYFSFVLFSCSKLKGEPAHIRML